MSNSSSVAINSIYAFVSSLLVPWFDLHFVLRKVWRPLSPASWHCLCVLRGISRNALVCSLPPAFLSVLLSLQLSIQQPFSHLFSLFSNYIVNTPLLSVLPPLQSRSQQPLPTRPPPSPITQLITLSHLFSHLSSHPSNYIVENLLPPVLSPIQWIKCLPLVLTLVHSPLQLHSQQPFFTCPPSSLITQLTTLSHFFSYLSPQLLQLYSQQLSSLRPFFSPITLHYISCIPKQSNWL